MNVIRETVTGTSEAMKNLFTFFDVQKTGYITAPQVQLLHEEIRLGGISMSQVMASIEHKQIDKHFIYLSDLTELIQEMDRRYYLIQDLQWEFAMLDRSHKGVIPVMITRFLMEARHGKSFSLRTWERLLSSRPVPQAPMSFAEIEVELCNVMQPDVIVYERPDPKVQEDKEYNEANLRAEKQSRQRRKIEERQSAEKARIFAEENEKKLEAERRQSELQENNAEDERKKLAEERERNAKNAEAMDEEAKAEEELAAHQEKMLLDAIRKESDTEKKKRAQKDAKAATKKAEKAKKKRIRTTLKVAVQTEDRDKLTKATNDFKEAKLVDEDGDLVKAERLLKRFQCSDALHDGISKRLVQQLDSAVSSAKKNGFDKRELTDLVARADELLVRLRRLEKLRHEVLELKSSTIAEIRSYQKPQQVVHNVMMATYLLLGNSQKETQKWTNVQVLLGKTGRENLKRRIGLLNVSDIDNFTAKRAKSLMGEIDLESIRDVSAGAATFYVWVDGMVEEILST